MTKTIAILVFVFILCVNLMFILKYILELNRDRHTIDGILHVADHDGKDSYTLEIMTPLEEVDKKDVIRLRVHNHRRE